MISRLAELLFKDFWLKLFSLALALLIWFTIFQAIKQQGSPVYNASENIKERTFYNLPVVKISSMADVSALKVTPDEVQVTVQGDAKSVDSLQSEDIKARVDLSGLLSDKAQHKAVEVSIPAGLSYVHIEPAEVQVTFPAKPASPSK